MRDDRLYFVHIIECIDRIERYTAEGREAFLGDTRTQDAVLRNLSRTGALILAVRRGESDLATPEATFRLEAGDVLVVVGQPQQLKGAYQVLTGGAQAEPA